MRVLTSLFLLFLCQITFAAPSASITHSHAGRTHTHPLPAQGVGHRHGGGQVGVAVGGQSAGSISSSVIYPNQPSKRVPVIESYPEVNNSSSRAPVNPPKRAPIKRFPSTRPASRFSLSKGDATCRRGEADCNVCAANVQQQFQKASAGQISWQTKPWGFSWMKSYPPFNKRPVDVFNGKPVYALNIPNKHVQGFVRTNSTRFPYAGSHSHQSRGGIFVIERNRNGNQYLSTLIPAKSNHPSGVQVMGKYLMYGEGNTAYFRDINNPNNNKYIKFRLQGANFGGGLGAIRLSTNNYLLVTTGPGGKDSRPRFNRFYHLRGSNGRPNAVRFINQSAVKSQSVWPKNLKFSENLSLVTECGTGDVYAIHTTGDEKGVKAIRGKGYWRLSKLTERNGSLNLKPISAFTKGQNMSSCSILAAATVHVNPQNKLEFYCHGYAKNRNGSGFNVLGSSNKTNDSFRFKVGTVR